MDRTAMTTDPPGLDEATRIFNDAAKVAINTEEIIRALLAFAARQPRPITEAMITGAYETLRARLVMTMRSLPEAAGRHLAYEVLRAAEKARREFPNG